MSIVPISLVFEYNFWKHSWIRHDVDLKKKNHTLRAKRKQLIVFYRVIMLAVLLLCEKKKSLMLMQWVMLFETMHFYEPKMIGIRIFIFSRTGTDFFFFLKTEPTKIIQVPDSLPDITVTGGTMIRRSQCR